MNIVESAPNFAAVAQRPASPCAKSRSLDLEPHKPASRGTFAKLDLF
jgi:hypothetical protein